MDVIIVSLGHLLTHISHAMQRNPAIKPFTTISPRMPNSRRLAKFPAACHIRGGLQIRGSGGHADVIIVSLGHLLTQISHVMQRNPAIKPFLANLRHNAKIWRDAKFCNCQFLATSSLEGYRTADTSLNKYPNGRHHTEWIQDKI